MTFDILAATPPGFASARLARAAGRAGLIGVVDLEHTELDRAVPIIQALVASRVEFTVAIPGVDAEAARLLEPAIGRGLTRLIIADATRDSLGDEIASIRGRGIRVLVQATSVDEARRAQECGADATIVKGNESGGRVGEETTFVLLQHVLPHLSIPVYARGGIGLHTAAACLAAGAAGVVLDWQLALTEESELPEAVKARIARMDGGETAILGQDSALKYRAYSRPGETAYVELKEMEQRFALSPRSDPETLRSWKSAVEARVSEQRLLLFSQDASFAAPLAASYRTVAGVCQAVRDEAVRQCLVAARLDALGADGPLAQSHGTRYPIVQGPMTRVSDRAAFAAAVAEGGGLPFLALALMGPSEVGALLEETRRLLGNRPWGIGILGFVPKELRDVQLAEARKHEPPFAIIAGGRPDQAKALEEDGTKTYLHVPSPELLRSFLEAGACRVVFEGRECGGHVGPRSSFVLWELMIRVILGHLSRASGPSTGDDCHVLFAGGIHDARSAAMVSAIAAPLSERGVRVGVLIGTGYLFTKEAVATDAITEGFQQEAVACRETVLLESGVGHATRCANTRFGDYFSDEKRRLLQEGRSKDDVRDALERLNLGRLRIAAKGIARGEARSDGSPTYEHVPDDVQRHEGMYMIGQVAALRDSVCSIEELHADVSAAAQLLDERLKTVVPPTRPSDIAIVGMSCILPKARNLSTYWHNILHKVNAIQEVPAERWDLDVYFDSDRRAPDRVYSRWGGFIDDVAFDPVRYGMPPNSVPAVEPLQLLTLELVREALLDAGLLNRPFNRERTSVILGAGGGVGDVGLGYGFRSLIPHYVALAGGTRKDADDFVEQLGDRLPHWTEDSFPGLLLNVAAGRVANRFDLGGANYVVDAACATSLAAVRLAAAELESRTSDVVIVAGADTMQSPFGYMCFSKTQALSPTGQCRTFDESADGIVISEGLAVAVLKRLDDAVRDGDRIYAVLKSVGASSDGKDKGLTAPRPIGQIRALDRAYAKAGVSPKTVGLIEAHGTGTVVGDRTEIESLTTFFSRAGAERQTCALGSVKSMIGHTKCTAGFAGLVKAALALHHKILPPTLGVTKPNSTANFSESAIYLNTEPRPWLERLDGAPRRAGVSAFGFGGTNFHALLEEYDPAAVGTIRRESPVRDWPAELFVWKGNTADEIVQAIDLVAGALSRGASPRLCDLAAAVYWQSGRKGGDHCLAVVATTLDDLATKLSVAKGAVASGGVMHDPRGIHYSPAAGTHDGKLAFVFAGQGSQRVNMACELALAFPQVRETFEAADRSLGTRLDKPLSRFIFPPPVFTDDEKNANELALRQTRVAQPSLGAADMAIFRLLGDLGIEPDMAGGHSYGELVALCAAGALSFDDLIRISEARGRFIVEAATPEAGTMAAVDADEKTVAAAVAGMDGVWLANMNAPNQTVISGTQAAVSEALRRLSERGLAGRPIAVACAFHSDLVSGARAPLRGALDACVVTAPRFPVFSNTTADVHSSNPDDIRALLADHLVRPVRFADEILHMHEAGARIFVEVGPGKVLTSLVERTLAGRSFTAVATDQPGRHGLVHLAYALAHLATSGVTFLAWRLFDGRVSQHLNLDRLVEETRPAELGPATWIVSSARSTPARGPKRVAARSAVRSGGAAMLPKSATSSPSPVLPTAAVQERQAPPANGGSVGMHPATVATTLASAPTRSDGAPRRDSVAERVLSQHHHVMSKFLETHKTVMVAYLGGVAAPIAAVVESTVAAAPPSLAPAPVQRVEMVAEPQKPVGAAEPVGIALAVPSADVAAPAVTQEIVIARLLEIVSQRTGYPPEMLNVDLDLEADLGIDSIKRVEILSALQTSALAPAESMDGAIEALSKLKTLRAIADWIVARQTITTTSAAAPPSEAPALQPQGRVPIDVPVSSTPAEAPITRMLVRVADAPISGAVDHTIRGITLITDDGGGIAERLAARLRDTGADSAVVRLDGTDMAAASARLVGELRGDRGIARLVHLAPLGGSQEFDEPAFQPRLDSELMPLFHLAHAAEADLRQASGGLIAATRLGGSFAVGAATAPFWPGGAAVSGFIKSVSREWPEVTCRTVDFESDAAPDLVVDALVAELASRDGLLEVGYKAGRRVTTVSVPTPIDATTSRVNIDNESVIVITGGARGITAEIALELAAAFKPNLVLVGRSPLPPADEPADLRNLTSDKDIKAVLVERLRRAGQKPAPAAIEAEYRRIRAEREIRANIAAMSAAGATVEYRSGDVGDPDVFGSVLDSIYERFGRIDGVVHGAGVIEDKFLRDKTPDSFARVLRPKVAGALTLVRRLRPESLKFLAFFSSVSARYGNRGQSDYAAANETLNKLAVWLSQRWPARVVSINWGPWKTEGGMVTAELAERFAKAGVELVSPAAGRRAFMEEVLHGASEDAEVVWGGPIAPQPSVAAADAVVDAEVRIEGFPLLGFGRSTEQWIDGRHHFELDADPAHHIYLMDHRLDGTPVMPMAMILELAAEVGAASRPDLRVTRVRDLRVLQGITFPKAAGRRLRAELATRASAQAGIAGVEFAVRSEEGGPRAHYRAVVELDDRPVAAPPTPRLELANRRSLPLSVAEAYERWLFHGPLFAGIAGVEALGDNGIVGTLRTSAPDALFAGGSGGAWEVDPVVIDSGLQLVILWVRTYLDQTPLPSRLGCYHRFGAMPTAEVRCEIEISGRRSDPTMRSDLRFIDGRGRLVAVLEDMQFTRSEALNRLSRSRVLATELS
jgi:acyl transferase domain-containing protein/NAD(P)H-dependent flavin oxidoreductase YrpB (nitropropane dioxygenase family)/NAD(P)-dependent dehydrogenase (short-subunit alcohol dehydrogenase family)